MKWSRSCLIVLAFFAGTFAQQFDISSDFFAGCASPLLEEHPGSIRAAAMGRAFTALSDEPAALACNPAGLAILKKKSISLSASTHFGSIALTPSNNILATKNYNGEIGGGARFNYFTCSLPFRAKDYNIVASVAVHNKSDLNEKTSLDVYDKLLKLHQTQKNQNAGGLMSLSAGAGMEAFKHIYIGACLNYFTGTQDRKIIQESQETGIDNQSWDRWQNKFSGISFDAGVIWKISRVISIGNKVTFPNKIYFDGLKSERDTGEKYSYSIGAYMFNPASIASGLSLRYTDDFVFTFDVVLRPWKKIQLVTDDFNQDRVFTTANSFHMGFEYLFHTRSMEFPLRFGFFTMPEQIFEYNSKKSGYKGDQVSSHFLTAGCGVHSGFISVQLALEYKILQYQHLFMNETLFPVDFAFSRYNIMLGVDFVL
jgi:hypothetical protein